MQSWINKNIENASWARFLIFFALLAVYSAWAFRDGGEFATALQAADGALPEMTPGFPAGLAEASYAKLGDAVAQYSVFQAIDIPYAIFNMFTFTSIIALGLKRFNLSASPLRYTLLFPPVYLLAEFIEDPLLIVLANGEPGEPEGLIIFQQLATNLKWASMTPALIFSLLALLTLVLTAGMRLIRGGAKS